MSYQGGCIIGVTVPYVKSDSGDSLSVNLYAANDDPQNYTISAFYQFSVSNYTDPPWQVMDGANLPGFDGTKTGSAAASWALAQVPIIHATLPYQQGLYIQCWPPVGNTFGIVNWPRCYISSGSNLYEGGTVTKLYKHLTDQIDWDPTKSAPLRALFCDYEQNSTMTDFYAGVSLQNTSALEIGAIWGEACPVRFVETPNTFELVSFRYQLKDDKRATTTTLDGEKRATTTGRPGADISVTFRWSDDGSVARNLQELLYLSQLLCRPLLLWLPAGIYYAGPMLELLFPTQAPVITMPAPGVYEMTLEGSCQP